MNEEEINLKENWQTLQNFLKNTLGKKPADLNGVLFIIGVQELGQGKKFFTKEQKQDLMHVAVCTVLSQSGLYALEGHDADGWPHFKQLKDMPVNGLIEQENFLKDHILLYFDQQGF